MRSKITMQNVVSTSRRLPIRCVYHAVPGFGKTSFGAQFPAPVFLMDAAETGLETLIDSGQLPATPHFPPLIDWDETIETLGAISEEPHEFKTLVLDTLGGLERLCHEHVCRKQFNGDWGEIGFAAYGRGPEAALAEWRGFLMLLDRLRERRGLRIVALAHTRITRFCNPEADDYDRYEPDVHRKTWSLTSRWADLILFGNYKTMIASDGAKKKGKGGTGRILYTERTAAFDAKHRHGLAPAIMLGSSPAAAYEAFKAAMQAGVNHPPVAEIDINKEAEVRSYVFQHSEDLPDAGDGDRDAPTTVVMPDVANNTESEA